MGNKFSARVNASKKNWERDFPLVKLIFEGAKALKSDLGKHEQSQERPLTYEEWQFKKRRESGFMY